MDPALVTSFIAVVGAITGLVSLILQRKRDKVDASDKLSDAAVQLIEPYQRRVQELERQDAELRQKITALEKRVTQLEREIKERDRDLEKVTEGAVRLMSQVISLGATPVYLPPERKAQS